MRCRLLRLKQDGSAFASALDRDTGKLEHLVQRMGQDSTPATPDRADHPKSQ